MPNSFTSSAPSDLRSSAWIVAYDPPIQLVEHGLSSSLIEVTSPMVLQPTSDGVETMVTIGVNLLWQSVVLPQ